MMRMMRTKVKGTRNDCQLDGSASDNQTYCGTSDEIIIYS